MGSISLVVVTSDTEYTENNESIKQNITASWYTLESKMADVIMGKK